MLLAAISVPLTAQKPDIQVDVDLVTIACAVATPSGTPAQNLTVNDFKLLDNGQPRAIRNFWREADLPLTVALVADVSASQAGYVKSHSEAISQFLKQVVGPRDRSMLVEVGQKARLIFPLSTSTTQLEASVNKIGSPDAKQSPLLGPPCRNAEFPHSCGGTVLWHALYYTAKTLEPVSGRKAIVVLSDGLDTGSDISLNDLIATVQASGILVYSIKYASPMRFLSISGAVAQAVSRGLNRLSREAGGLTFPNPGRNISEVFSKIEADLRNLYVLGFTPPSDARDGKFHNLVVAVTPPGFVVRSRAGYLAVKNNNQ